jgi:hypothetical protein
MLEVGWQELISISIDLLVRAGMAYLQMAGK